MKLKEEKVKPYFVKVHASRGYGDGLFKVLAARQTSERELKLFSESTGCFWIYEAHTSRDKSSAAATADLVAQRRQAAMLIGTRVQRRIK